MQWNADRKSNTTKFLQGKIYPGKSSPVKEITVRGNTRIVHLQDGQMFRQTKRALVKAFHTVLRGEQFHTAVRSIQPVGNTNKVVATVGGEKKGEEKVYSSKERAVAALKKRYGIK